MKKLILFAFMALVLTGCGGPQTVEEIEAQMQLEQSRAEIIAKENEAQRAFVLEQKKLVAEAEAAKPIDVRIAEEQTKATEAANDSALPETAAVVGGMVIGGMLLNKLFQ